MGLLGARTRHFEGTELSGFYPEPWIIRAAGLSVPYRFLLGRPMDGRIYSNATFWRSATSGYPSRRLRMAHGRRAMLRLLYSYGALLAVLLVALHLLEFSGAFWRVLLWHVSGVLLIGAPLVLRRTVSAYGLSVPWLERDEETEKRRWRLREITPGSRGWERETVRPLARALAPQLNRAYHPDTAAQWVSVPRDYRKEDGPPVEIRLPESFVPDHRVMLRIVKTASARLAVRGMHPTWLLENTSAPMLQLRSPIAPPEKVPFSDVRHFLEQSEEYRPFLGVAGAGQAVNVEMIEDSPNIGLSSAPGGGKSVLAGVVAAQALRWGWRVVVLDWKESKAFRWLRDLPGVTYITTIPEMHDFGEWIAAEIERRKASGLYGVQKLLVIRDEWNISAAKLMAYWQDMRATAEPDEKRTMPLVSPALRGFMDMDMAGREFGIHDLCIAQRFSARIFNGNGDQRECFGIRCATRFTPQTKKMLFGDMKPFPASPTKPGRWVVVAGEEVVEIQVPWCTDEELRELASGGVRSRDKSGEIHSTQDERLSPESTQPVRLARVIELPAAPVRTASLASLAAQLARYGVTRKILENERARDPEFPRAVAGDRYNGYTYDVEEMTEYCARRHARMTAEKVGS